jgi:DnaK suppressor protein
MAGKAKPAKTSKTSKPGKTGKTARVATPVKKASASVKKTSQSSTRGSAAKTGKAGKPSKTSKTSTTSKTSKTSPKVKSPASAKAGNKVKPQLAKKRVPGRPFPAKLQSTTKGDSTTITVTPREVTAPQVVVEEKKLMMPPPPKPTKSVKKNSNLKPLKSAPAPLVVATGEDPWTSAELKAIKNDLQKDLIRLRAELLEAESEMDDLVSASGIGAGDDQADAGSKTFEREHEMSLVYNARDMVLQTERAIERIDNKTYGRCEECGNQIGKARLAVFPRATLCMVCKAKEERR